MAEYKKQHYVPEFYLTYFVDERKQVWVYDKQQSKSFPSNPTNVGAQNYFYEPDDLTLLSDPKLLEKAFSDFEGKVSVVLSQLINDLENDDFQEIEGNEKDILCWHLVYQILRGTEHRELIRQMTEFAKELEILDGLTSEKDHHISLLLNNKVQLYDALNSHIWIIYKNTTEIPFYTSDNPVMKKGHYQDPVISMEGLASPGIEIFFPISPKFLLVLAESSAFKDLESHNNKMLLLDKEEYIIYYNAIQALDSYRFVYCNGNSFKHVEDILKHSPINADSKRKRIDINGQS